MFSPLYFGISGTFLKAVSCINLLSVTVAGVSPEKWHVFFFPIEINHRQYVIVIVIQHVYVTAFAKLLATLLPTI
jgi:hypothetical protein